MVVRGTTGFRSRDFTYLALNTLSHFPLFLLWHWVTSNLKYPFLDGALQEGKVIMMEHICSNSSIQMQFQIWWMIHPASAAEMRRSRPTSFLCIDSRDPATEGNSDWSSFMWCVLQYKDRNLKIGKYLFRFVKENHL